MMDFDDVMNIVAWLVVILIVGAIGYGVYWFFFIHEHVITYTEGTVVGFTNQAVGGGLFSGGGSRTLCIIETDEGWRYTNESTCQFILDDRVKIHWHDGVKKGETLLK